MDASAKIATRTRLVVGALLAAALVTAGCSTAADAEPARDLVLVLADQTMVTVHRAGEGGNLTDLFAAIRHATGQPVVDIAVAS